MKEPITMIDGETNPARSNSIFWILFALSYPTLLTLTYFLWLSSSSSTIQQTVYAIGKLIQFGFPVVYVGLSAGSNFLSRENVISRKSPDSALTPHSKSRLNDTPKTTLWLGTVFGCSVVAAMLLVYFFLLPEALVTQLSAKVHEKVDGMGLASPLRFLAVSLFYVVGHSFLEEYYWRWFVFNQLQQSMAMWQANLIAGLGFMAHHVVLLGTFFGWDSGFTYLLSLSVAVGGLVWAWLFNRQWGFRSAWLSHAIVDAGIFGLGLLILFGKPW